MNYKKQQEKYQVSLLDSGFFGEAQGGGIFMGWSLKRILQPKYVDYNFFEPIRTDVKGYFATNNIAWWALENTEETPSGHLLSSQTCCLNHLFALRKDKKAVLSIVKALGEKKGIIFTDVLPSPIDKVETEESYITFEFVLDNQELLNESSHGKRGKKCTSIDAVIYAMEGKKKWLIPIEWKYTETYVKQREEYNGVKYANFVTENSRIKAWTEEFHYEPLYELGRQTLLMEIIIGEKKLDADDFLHVVVIPTGNEDMRIDAENFASHLKDTSKFMVVSPKDLVMPLKDNGNYKDLIDYLSYRYWQ